jgi:hypothetical protein
MHKLTVPKDDRAKRKEGHSSNQQTGTRRTQGRTTATRASAESGRSTAPCRVRVPCPRRTDCWGTQHRPVPSHPQPKEREREREREREKERAKERGDPIRQRERQRGQRPPALPHSCVICVAAWRRWPAHCLPLEQRRCVAEPHRGGATTGA